jgi:O-antigen/teichoic acid export membrane protein
MTAVEGVDRWAGTARRHALALHTNFVVLAVLGLVVNPIVLGAVGSVAFGVWKTAQQAVGFLSLADGRATQALKWVIASRDARRDGDALRRDVGATLVVWVLWLPVACAAVVVLVRVALPQLVGGADPGLTLAVGAVLAAGVVAGGVLGIPDAVLRGSNLVHLSAYSSTAVGIGVAAASVVAVRVTGSIVALAVTTVAGAVVLAVVTWAVAARRVPWWGAGRPRAGEVGRLSRFSGWLLAWATVDRVLLSAELLLLGAVLGPAVAASFAITSYVTVFAVGAGMLTTGAMMPSLGGLLARDDGEAARLVALAKSLNAAIIVIAGGAIVLLNETFVSLWVGAEHYLGDEVNVLMVVAMAQTMLLRTDAQILDVSLQVARMVTLVGTCVVLSVVVAWLVLRETQSPVAMYVALVAARLPASVLAPRLAREQVPHEPAAWPGLAAIAVGLTACAALAALVPPTHAWVEVVVSVVALAGLAVAVHAWVLTPDAREWLLSRAGRGGTA